MTKGEKEKKRKKERKKKRTAFRFSILLTYKVTSKLNKQLPHLKRQRQGKRTSDAGGRCRSLVSSIIDQTSQVWRRLLIGCRGRRDTGRHFRTLSRLLCVTCVMCPSNSSLLLNCKCEDTLLFCCCLRSCFCCCCLRDCCYCLSSCRCCVFIFAVVAVVVFAVVVVAIGATAASVCFSLCLLS